MKSSRSGTTADIPVVIGTGLVALDVVISIDNSQAPLVMAGGTCGNVLTILSYLGWDSFPVARLDTDPASEMVKRDLARWGVSLDFATQNPRAETPVIVQTIGRDRHGTPKHRFSMVCPECGAWYPSFRAITVAAASEVADALIGALPSGFVPRVYFFDRVSRGALILAETMAEAGALVVFEPAGIGNPQLFEEALAIAHVLKYSHERLPHLAGRRRQKSSVLLEIETWGGAGLRYRSATSASQSWREARALTAPSLADTAGAGDWCTAGILAKLARGGRAGFERLQSDDIRAGIKYGQATAAIACAYEGARGAMIPLTRAAFNEAVKKVFEGNNILSVVLPNQAAPTPGRLSYRLDVAVAVCPACS